MKKLIVFVCVLLLVTMILPLSISAAAWYVKENPTITVPNAIPTIDGTINSDEGWSSAGYINLDTGTGAYLATPLSTVVDFYFAYTEDGLYFAANTFEYGACYTVRFYDVDGNTDHDTAYLDENAGSYKYEPGGFPAQTQDGYTINYYKIDDYTTSAPAGVVPDVAFWNIYTGNSFQYSTGEDDIDGFGGWNGDVIGLSLDLLGAWEYEGFLGNNDYVPMYNFGIFEDGSIRVCRNRSNNDTEITEHCTTAGKASDNGFCFEAVIPWDIIIEDQNDYGAVLGLEQTFSKENVLAEGAIHRGSVTLMDRFYDPDAEMVDTWGRFITVCETTASGTPGHLGSCDNIACMGLKIQMGALGSAADDTTIPAGDDTTKTDDTTKSDDTTTKSNDTTKSGASTTKAGVSTTKAASTGKPSTGTSSTQTFDAGIAVAIGTLTASALGLAYSKKRRY